MLLPVEFNFNSHVFLVMYKDTFSKSRCLFFKSRRETTVLISSFSERDWKREHKLEFKMASFLYSKCKWEFFEGLLSLLQHCGDCVKENTDGGHAEFLARRQEETEKRGNCRLSSRFKKHILIYNKYFLIHDKKHVGIEIKFYTILTHSKSKLTLIVSILIVNLWIWIIKLHLWYWLCIHFLEKSTKNRFLEFFLKLLSRRLDYQPLFGKMSPHS